MKQCEEKIEPSKVELVQFDNAVKEKQSEINGIKIEIKNLEAKIEDKNVSSRYYLENKIVHHIKINFSFFFIKRELEHQREQLEALKTNSKYGESKLKSIEENLAKLTVSLKFLRIFFFFYSL